jgi:formylmethanofuran dehydrogenase subunit E
MDFWRKKKEPKEKRIPNNTYLTTLTLDLIMRGYSMKTEKILSGDDFKRCAEFHGHICQGIALGYRAALSGMGRLQKHRAVDEDYTFFERSAGKGVRVSLRPGVIEQTEEQRILMDKIRKGIARREGKSRFEELHFQKTCEILEKPEEELFSIREIDGVLPPKAKVEPSVICDQCGEPTMASRVVDQDGRKVCRDCAQE